MQGVLYECNFDCKKKNKKIKKIKKSHAWNMRNWYLLICLDDLSCDFDYLILSMPTHTDFAGNMMMLTWCTITNTYLFMICYDDLIQYPMLYNVGGVDFVYAIFDHMWLWTLITWYKLHI